jgi:hypothetical protein
VLDSGVTGYFSTIDYKALMAQVARRVSDRRMLKLIRASMCTGVLDAAVYSVAGSGTPESSPIYPSLANVALYVLDEERSASEAGTGVLARYCIDFVTLCGSRGQAEHARDRVQQILGRPIEAVVTDLNPVLRGWGSYFRWGDSARKFAAIDMYAHERLAIFAGRKEGRRGRNWDKRFNYSWKQNLVYTTSAEWFVTGLRMPDGERCRKAGCGRTTCQVLTGGSWKRGLNRYHASS